MGQPPRVDITIQCKMGISVSLICVAKHTDPKPQETLVPQLRRPKIKDGGVSKAMLPGLMGIHQSDPLKQELQVSLCAPLSVLP